MMLCRLNMGSSRDVSESRWCWRLPEGAASVLVGISDAVRWYVKVEKSVAIVAEMRVFTEEVLSFVIWRGKVRVNLAREVKMMFVIHCQKLPSGTS